MSTRRGAGFFWIALWVVLAAQWAPAQTISWTRQFGSATDDFAFGVSTDITGIYVGGYASEDTIAFQPCRTSAASANVTTFLRRYNSAGVLTLPGPADPFETVYDVAVSSTGDHYAVGSSLGTGEAFVRSYTSAGAAITNQYFGVSSKAFGVAVDASGVYVVGFAVNLLGITGADAFVRKYTLDLSTVLWTTPFGGAGTDTATAVALDGTGAYVSGYTGADVLNAADGFVNKYDATSGSQTWTRSISTGVDDFAFGVTVNGGGVYVAGYTSGALTAQPSAGLSDAFVRKYDAAGTAQWTRQFGTASDDFALSVAANSSGVYVAGYTGGALGTSSGDADAYVRKYETSGVDIWTSQFGTAAGDVGWDVAADADALYVSGCTAGALGGPSAGGSDAYLTKFEAGLLVSIDIRPGASPNNINLGSNGVVQVAILSSATFNATTVDPMSVSLAGATVKVKGNGTYQATVQDVNGDSLPDLIVHILTEALTLSGTDTDAVLKGLTFSGQAIHGKDTIRVVP